MMSANGSSETECRSEVSLTNTTCPHKSITVSAISMTVGILSNTLAFFILVKAYRRFRLKSKASFLLFASGLVVTDCLGHLINGSLVLYVYAYRKKWEAFDPHHILCDLFGVCIVFFGLSPLFLGSAMAVERYIGVTRPLFHSTALAAHHMKRLLGLTWLLAALVALLPVLLRRSYHVQCSQSWCFFRMEGPGRHWLDVLLALLFSTLGLLALVISLVFNMLTCCTLLLSTLRSERQRHSKGTSHHFEMICQLLAIMLVSCVCWGPLLVHVIILSTQTQSDCDCTRLLLVVRIATWNQILDPWIYILLRKAILKKLFLLIHSCWGPRSYTLRCWKCSMRNPSVETGSSVSGKPDWYCLDEGALPKTTIKPMTEAPASELTDPGVS